MADRITKSPSPYLQQHADNPVDWWPWCDEAFEEARRRDVPVFLSIGYSTCHWCHVMAHESFEDPAVAELLNDAFVCIKVDREERPDVDATYMQACLAQNGSGGWPLTALLTPDRDPFFTGTYFPRDSHGERIGLVDLVPRVVQAWHEERDKLVHQAEHMMAHLRKAPPTGDQVPQASAADEAARDLAERFDAEHGGFGGAPRFPSPHQLVFLLQYSARRGPQAAKERDMALQTLSGMAAGGIHDHLGGGFHRYSTDPEWRLPHFEKMLYDQATQLWAFAEGFQASDDPDERDHMRTVAGGIVDYVLRDLQSPAGTFYSAEDADSEGEEGRFYTWTHAEVQAVLGDDAALFCDAYDVRPGGNHHDEATGRPSGRNVLMRVQDNAALAARHDLDPDEVAARLPACRESLWAVREDRVRPSRDEKVLTDWNSLMIASLCRAGSAMQEPAWVDAAVTAADAVADAVVHDGAVCHMQRYRPTQEGGDHVGEHGFLDDHAAWLWASTELHQATQEVRWLRHAVSVASVLLTRFRRDGGAWVASPGTGLGGSMDAYDGAAPSGASLVSWNLWRLGLLTGDRQWTEAAENAWQAVGPQVAQHPAAFTAMLLGLEGYHAGGVEVVVTGGELAADRLAEVVWTTHAPGTVLVRDAPGIEEVAPWTVADRDRDESVAFLCRDQACRQPTDDPERLRDQLQETARATVPSNG